MTKGKELAELIVSNHNAFQKYESDCRLFIKSLREHLLEYLEYEPGQIRWLDFEEPTEQEMMEREIKELSADKRMFLRNDAFYGFSYVIYPTGDYYDVAVRLRVKFDGSIYLLKVGDSEFKINISDIETFTTAIDFLIDEIINMYATEFENFIHGKSSKKFGFLEKS